MTMTAIPVISCKVKFVTSQQFHLALGSLSLVKRVEVVVVVIYLLQIYIDLPIWKFSKINFRGDLSPELIFADFAAFFANP